MMGEITSVHTDRAPGAIGPYSQAVSVDGWVFCSGQIPMDPASGELVDGGIGAQTDQVLKNLTAVLDAAGSSLARVVKTTVFLRDMGDFPGMNEVYARHFGDHRPARAAVAVRTLPKDVSVEIEAVARTS
jgi:2-iminobutanoate/2-iminopropanoate deaminase